MKKFLAVALATVMTLAMSVSSFAETASSLDNTAGWANPSNAGLEELTGDFDVTYKFTIDSVGATNWNNFVIELRAGEEGAYDYLDIRADAFAFTNGPTFGVTFADPATSVLTATWAGQPADWAAWLAACPGSEVEVNLVRTGDAFAYTATFEDGTVMTATLGFGTVDVPDTVALTLLGDGAKFSGITFTNNTSAGDTETEGTETETEGTVEETVTKTGDMTTVLPVVVLAVAAMAVVVVMRKRTVAE